MFHINGVDWNSILNSHALKIIVVSNDREFLVIYQMKYLLWWNNNIERFKYTDYNKEKEI